MKEQGSMEYIHREADKYYNNIRALLAKTTPARGIEIDLETSLSIQEVARVNPSLIRFQRKIISEYLDPEKQKTVFCRTKDRLVSVGTVGLLKKSDITVVIIWNRHPREEKPKLWVGFYNPLQWAEASELAEIELGNARINAPLRQLPKELLITLKQKLTKAGGYWASPAEVKYDPKALPPIIGLKPYSRFPHIYVADIGREERIRAVGEELIQEYAPRLHQTFCKIKEEFLLAIKK